MLAYMLRRLLLTLLAFLALTYLVFFLTTPQGVIALHHLAWNDLLPINYLSWLIHLLQGDLGFSIRDDVTVRAALLARLPVTLLLIIPAFIVQETLALTLGLLAGARERSIFDRIFTGMTFWLASIPSFLLAMAIVVVICGDWKLLPFGGLNDIRASGAPFGTADYWAYFHAHQVAALLDLMGHLALPVLLLGLVNAAGDGQLVRLAMIDALKQEYIRAARARGISQRIILWKHALRTAAGPLVTNSAAQLPNLIFSAMIFEFIFGLPGLGDLFVRAVYAPPGGTIPPRDYDVISAYFLILIVVATLATLAADVVYAMLDPRVRLGGAASTEVHASLASAHKIATFGRFSITTGRVAVSGLVLIGMLIIGVSVRQAFSTRPLLSGAWAGTISLATTVPYQPVQSYPVFLHLSENRQSMFVNGTLSGSALVCAPVSNGAMYAISGYTDTTTIHLVLTAQQSVYTFEGGDANNLSLAGSYTAGQNFPQAAQLHIHRSSQPAQCGSN